LIFKPVTVRRGVWVGAGVKITAGVEIGEESAIGAGAVVTRDIPPRSVAAGVPARVLRRRWEDEQ
jgi:acetyltransferase-like isoleucine patch superfamily enzyme